MYIVPYIYIYRSIIYLGLNMGDLQVTTGPGGRALGQVAWWLPNNAAMPINEFLGRHHGLEIPSGKHIHSYGKNIGKWRFDGGLIVV